MLGLGLGLTQVAVRQGGGAPPVVLPATVLMAVEGDSITYGLATAGVSHINNMVPSLTAGPAYTLKKVAASGDTTSAMVGEFNSGSCLEQGGEGVGPCLVLFPKALNIAYISSGANDGVGDNTSSLNSYRTIRNWVRAARAKPFDRVGVGTLISRGTSGAAIAGAVYDANTVYSNTLLRALWNSDLDVDYLFDYGAITGFTTRAAQLAAGYTPDTTHPDAGGYVPMTTVAVAGFNAMVAGAGVRVAPPATWSYIDYCDIYLTLSNGNRTALGGGVGEAVVHGFAEAKDLTYWETVTDNISGTLVGLCNRALEANIYSANANLGNSPNAISVLTGYGGDVYRNGSLVLSAWETWANGDVQQWAIRKSTQRLWIRKPGGLWNGSGTANPATGVGGIDISGLGTGPLYPAAYLNASPASVTTRFAAAQQTGPVPSGFASIA